MLSSTKSHIDEEGGDALFRWMGFRRRTSKSVKKVLKKVLTFPSGCGIMYMSRGEGRCDRPDKPQYLRSNGRPTSSCLGFGYPIISELPYRATAEEYSRWGVAVGILNTEDCGEEGNP